MCFPGRQQNMQEPGVGMRKGWSHRSLGETRQKGREQKLRVVKSSTFNRAQSPKRRGLLSSSALLSRTSLQSLTCWQSFCSSTLLFILTSLSTMASFQYPEHTLLLPSLAPLAKWFPVSERLSPVLLSFVNSTHSSDLSSSISSYGKGPWGSLPGHAYHIWSPSTPTFPHGLYRCKDVHNYLYHAYLQVIIANIYWVFTICQLYEIVIILSLQTPKLRHTGLSNWPKVNQIVGNRAGAWTSPLGCNNHILNNWAMKKVSGKVTYTQT